MSVGLVMEPRSSANELFFLLVAVLSEYRSSCTTPPPLKVFDMRLVDSDWPNQQLVKLIAQAFQSRVQIKNNFCLSCVRFFFVLG